MVEFRFELESGLAVLAFCPFSPESQVSVTEFRKSLERLGDVAMFAGHSDDGGVPDEMRQAAFIWSLTDGWRLAWWASEESVFTTDWFRRHAPAPERFLGYTPPTLRLLEPYMPELPGAAHQSRRPCTTRVLVARFGPTTWAHCRAKGTVTRPPVAGTTEPAPRASGESARPPLANSEMMNGPGGTRSPHATCACWLGYAKWWRRANNCTT